jgi:hypothetical protein
MLVTYLNETKVNKDNILGMTVNEYVRWLCLIEAIDHIETKASQLNINLDKSNSWIQPIDIKKYIRERFNSLKDEVIDQL